MEQIVLDNREQQLRDLFLAVAADIDKSRESKQDDTILRFTGGWVRDKLLGLSSHDIDVAISNMTGTQFVERLKAFLMSSDNASKYGVSQKEVDRVPHLIGANPEKSKHLETTSTRLISLDIDFVNLRKETYAKDSRTPQMEFGTAEEDAQRRDATINALFYNIHTDEVEDLTKRGLEDLKIGLIRTPLEPKQTFEDDPLRVLRLIRFASRYGFQIDGETKQAMASTTIKEALQSKISRERVQAEVQKMLAVTVQPGEVHRQGPMRALATIDRLDLYQAIFMSPQTPFDQVPPTLGWYKVYEVVAALLDKTALENNKFFPSQTLEYFDRLQDMLSLATTNPYQIWILAALVPWTGSQVKFDPKKDGNPASKAVREGLAESNEICKLVSTAFENSPGISKTCRQMSSSDQNSPQALSAEDRSKLGWKLRQLGSTWRLQFVLALLQEYYAIPRDSKFHDTFHETTIRYDQFLRLIYDHDLNEAYSLQPVVNGKQIMSEFKAKGGKWMTVAIELVLKWQYETVERSSVKPGNSEAGEQALQMLRDRKSELDIP